MLELWRRKNGKMDRNIRRSCDCRKLREGIRQGSSNLAVEYQCQKSVSRPMQQAVELIVSFQIIDVALDLLWASKHAVQLPCYGESSSKEWGLFFACSIDVNCFSAKPPFKCVDI